MKTIPFNEAYNIGDLRRVIQHWKDALKRGDIPVRFRQELKEEIIPELEELLSNFKED